MQVSWHHDRDGWGTVLGPQDSDGFYPILVNGGITYDEAVAKFGEGNVTRFDQPIPVVIDAPKEV